MEQKNVKIEESWKAVLNNEFSRSYFKDLSNFVKEEYKTGVVYPKPQNVFRAFELCPFQDTKVVIIGQDPYHGQGQANGLCFAVGGEGQPEITIPPSLQNIFKEIESDLGFAPDRNGDLSRWAKQGILLLNATLTVRANTPGSHQKKGWEEFTDSVIEKLSHEKENIVFILWGNYAKKKGEKIDRARHLVLEAQHPSPFSAYNGFFGSKHFSKTNKYLRDKGLGEIDWK
jgi:uracil-DNA glycosylase